MSGVVTQWCQCARDSPAERVLRVYSAFIHLSLCLCASVVLIHLSTQWIPTVSCKYHSQTLFIYYILMYQSRCEWHNNVFGINLNTKQNIQYCLLVVFKSSNIFTNLVIKLM